MKFPLLIILALSLPSCAWFSNVAWPAVVSCGVEPSKGLIDGATQALKDGGDIKKKMEALAKTYGAEMVICVVRELISRSTMMAAAPDAEPVPLGPLAVERAEAFLESIGHSSK